MKGEKDRNISWTLVDEVDSLQSTQIDNGDGEDSDNHHNIIQYPQNVGQEGSKKFQLQPFRSPLPPSDRYSGYPCCPCYQSILSQFLEKQSSECSTCIFPVSPKAVDAICALTVTSSHLRWYVCSCFVFVCVRDSVRVCLNHVVHDIIHRTPTHTCKHLPSMILDV